MTSKFKEVVQNRRGYKYMTAEDFIKNKNDPELLIPEYELTININGAPKNNVTWRHKHREACIKYLIEFSNEPYFGLDKTNILCLAVEIFDKVLLTMPKFPEGVVLTTLLGACMCISAKIFIDHFEVTDSIDFIASYSSTTKTNIALYERKILKKLNYNISYRFSVMWFIDWLKGFDDKKNRKAIENEVVKAYLSGEYRTVDPFTLAYDILKKPKKSTIAESTIESTKFKTCESQLRADIIEQAKKLGIAIGKKTKAQLCHEINELTDSEFSESSDDSYYIMDRSMQTSLEQDKWLDIVEKLTDTSYTRFTPDELAAIVKKQDLLKYARSMGLKVTGMSAIGIANAIYEDTKPHKDF